MKKIIVIMLALLLSILLVACVGDDDMMTTDEFEQGMSGLSDPSMQTSEKDEEGTSSKDKTTEKGDESTSKNDGTTENGEDGTSNKDDITQSPSQNINQSTILDEQGTTLPRPSVNPSEKIILGTPSTSSSSGYEPLPKVEYEVKDPNNTANLSTKMISHSHGPASGGEPHFTVVDFQKEFDKFGAYTLDTTAEDKSIYLTFDCGYEHDNLTSKVLDVLKEKDVPATFFCTLDHIKAETDLINRMIKEGHIVGNHSTTHPSFATISRTQMKDEIETTENYLRENFGYTSKFFRCPKGEYNTNALDLVQSLGYTNVFWSVAYNDWDVNNIQGKEYATKTVLDRLHDGAIILLHSVSVDNANALGDIIDGARELGYSFKSLEEL